MQWTSSENSVTGSGATFACRGSQGRFAVDVRTEERAVPRQVRLAIETKIPAMNSAEWTTRARTKRKRMWIKSMETTLPLPGAALYETGKSALTDSDAQMATSWSVSQCEPENNHR